jgi:membrane protein CcdC involved in cytochrome C biogenesis
MPRERNVQTSIFIARLLGPILLAVGASILINPTLFRTMATELLRSVTLVYLFGVMDFAAGLAILLTHNVWVANWRVLITLLGCLLLIRGAARILLTEKLMGFAAKAFRNKRMVPVAGAVTGILGLVLCYFGYVA